MIIILLTNGMSAFGLEVLANWGVSSSVKYPYLSIWYAAGLASIGIPMLLRGVLGGRREIVWGALAAALSVGGQLAIAVALQSGLPGEMVFPIVIGGSIFVVAISGRLLFSEKLHPLSWGGIVIGFVAVIMLSLH